MFIKKRWECWNKNMFYIDNTEDLVNICNEIVANTNIIALDTEFIKQKEYFPTLSIIQLSFFNGQIIKNCIIDVLAENFCLDSFFEILSNEKIKKIFHSCSQDLEALYFISKKIPVGIEDTQVMAEFCGMKPNLSYKDLVKDTLKVVIEKSKKVQTSDWLQRPLSEKQLNYAIGDVDYLLEMYIYLAQQLDKNKTFKYYKAEMNERYGKNMIQNLINNSWKKMRFKLGNKTNIYMIILKRLCILREKIAMEENVIKSSILPDNFFKVLLTEQPKTIAELNEVFADDVEIMNKSKDIKRIFLNEYNAILEQIKSENIEEKPYITELKNRSLLQKLEEMNDYIIAKCKQLDINPEVVQNKGDLIAFLTDSEKIEDLFAKWKIELFGKRLKEIKAR